MMVLGQYVSALVGTWWYWVSITWYMRVLGQYGTEVEIWSDVTIKGRTDDEKER